MVVGGKKRLASYVSKGTQTEVKVLKKKVNKLYKEAMPENQSDYVVAFNATECPDNFALLNYRISGMFESGSTDQLVKGNEIFIKGIKVRGFIQGVGMSQDGDVQGTRMLVYTASSNALATDITPVAADLFKTASTTKSALNSMTESSVVSVKKDKRFAQTLSSPINYINEYIKVNKKFKFATDGSINSAAKGKTHDWYISFLGGDIQGTSATDNPLIYLEIQVFFTDA